MINSRSRLSSSHPATARAGSMSRRLVSSSFTAGTSVGTDAAGYLGIGLHACRCEQAVSRRTAPTPLLPPLIRRDDVQRNAQVWLQRYKVAHPQDAAEHRRRV